MVRYCDHDVQNRVTCDSYHWLTGDAIWSYACDGNGSLARRILPDGKAKHQYQFNSFDQLTKVVKGTYKSNKWTWTTAGEYFYDANGALAKSVEGTTITEYVSCGHDPLCEKNTGTGVFTDYIYVNGRMVAKQTGSDIYYYFKDALGSTRQVWQSGATKAAFSVATYAPFGTPVTPSGTEKFKYAGEMLVGAAGSSPGLYYIGARWMDPELGRWLSLDPQLGKLSSPQTMNRYVYCVNNPLRFTDSTGMWLESLFDIGCIIYDIYELQKNPTWGNVGWLLLDVGCLIAPGVPALSPFFKGVKGADKAMDAERAADKGKDLSKLLKPADDVITVRHYTDYEHMVMIEKSRSLKAPSYVTLPTEIPRGSTAREIERMLEIKPGKGEYYIDLLVRKSDMHIPDTSPLTSGGKVQFQIVQDIRLPERAAFLPWFTW